MSHRIAIIGCGNIGTALAKGFARSKKIAPEHLVLTTHSERSRDRLIAAGFSATTDNCTAIEASDRIIIAVTPQQIDGLMEHIRGWLEPGRHVVYSVVSGVSCAQVCEGLGCEIPVIRVMPNTAAAICESMTCLAHDGAKRADIRDATHLFSLIGETIWLEEEMMVPATVLCACGTAFFLRAIRAASQGGIEIGFHPEQAIPIAAQVAKGAAAPLTSSEQHRETEIDKVTTPKGSTITGLNTMEHQGFSSAMIQGILASYHKTSQLYGPSE